MSAVTICNTQAAIEHCREITRQRARNFYYGLKLLPEPQRSAMFAIYAWMREADDLVDAAIQSRKSSYPEGDGSRDVADDVKAFRALTDGALDGKPESDEPLWHALAFAAKRFPLTPEHFHAMIDGQLEDVNERSYDTFDHLKRYCYRVASSVGLVCIEVWGYTSEKAPALAIDRGIAFQLTNILRDFREDYDAGRVYLPSREFARFDLSPSDLRAWAMPEACEQFVLEQVSRARSYYEQSSPLDELINPECVPTLWAMTTIYRGLLEKMSEQPRQLVSNKRIRLSAMQKGMIALRAKWQNATIRNGAAT